MNESQKKIYFAIGNGDCSPALIAETTQLSSRLVCYWLAKMVKEGLVIRRARGFYVIAKNQPTMGISYLVDNRPLPCEKPEPWFHKFTRSIGLSWSK